MKIDFDQVLKNLDGKPFDGKPTVEQFLMELQTIANEDTGKTIAQVGREVSKRLDEIRGAPRTLASFCFAAIDASEKARSGSADDKLAMAKLARKIVDGGIVEIGESDVATLKSTLKDYCHSFAYLACVEALDQEYTPTVEAAE